MMHELVLVRWNNVISQSFSLVLILHHFFLISFLLEQASKGSVDLWIRFLEFRTPRMSHLLVIVSLKKTQLRSEQEFGYLAEFSAAWPNSVLCWGWTPCNLQRKRFLCRYADRIQSRKVIDIVDIEKIIQSQATMSKTWCDSNSKCTNR